MSSTVSLLMAQINPKVGAIKANAQKIIDIIEAHQNTHDIIIFPELALTGYPPEDLLFRSEFFEEIIEALHTIQAQTKDCHVIIGHPSLEDTFCFNSASVFNKGKTIALYHKQHLPNNSVFDEKRYFKSGPSTACVLTIRDHQFGLCICEDIWQPGPVEQLAKAHVDLMIVINASPFDQHKYEKRESLLKAHAQLGMGIIYINQVGGQDELVFDGQSMVLDAQGVIQARAPAFKEHLQSIKINNKNIQKTDISPLLSKEALIYQALLCGLHDYVQKNGFPGVLLGLSGGIDSALTLCLAVDAFGASRVHAVMMPSRYSADMSLEDAKNQALALGVNYTVLPIEPVFNTCLDTLKSSFEGFKPDITEENIQARVRGLLLMALSNKTGHMLLTTSNKSESAVGYSTLYGDMAGGFAVIKDVLKTQVYALAHYRNHLDPVIPDRVITRAPTAELAEGQTDQDHLPDYAVLDAILVDYMEHHLSPKQIIENGFEADDVLKIVGLIKRNEYKRKQAAPGVKISSCAFGKDWRYPLTSGF